MRKFLFSALLSLVILLDVSAVSAWAQAGQQGSFDQFPSFIEITSDHEGTQSVLRCGYFSPNGHGISSDNGYREVSVMNAERRSYSRLQRIDDYIIATSIDPSGGPDLMLQMIGPDGLPKAKLCQTDANNDTISGCRAIQPFTFVDQMKGGDAKIAQQCADLVRQSASRMNPTLADPKKTEEFKSGLRQKVNILSAP